MDDVYRIEPVPEAMEDWPLWAQYRVFKWVDGYGWDEVNHPTSKRLIIEPAAPIITTTTLKIFRRASIT